MSVTPIQRRDEQALDLESCHDASWQAVASSTVRTAESLAEWLELDLEQLPPLREDAIFSLKVPLTFVSKMRKGDPNDPLLRQVMALAEEDDEVAGYLDDPLDEHHTDVPGLIRKYPGRALLTAATACPIHCRYCFRRHFPYEENRLSPSSWAPALEAIRADTSLSEVILSGGEPLMMKDSLLETLLEELDAIEHLSLLRIHSRFPVAIPQRLTTRLATALDSLRCDTTLVLHANHPAEIDDSLLSHLEPFVRSNTTLLNQSALLRGVNDDVMVLELLSRRLHHAGVLPYYLHVLDPVRGAAHFDVPDAEAIALVGKLQNRVPGYLLPKLVREVPGRLSKTRLPDAVA